MKKQGRFCRFVWAVGLLCLAWTPGMDVSAAGENPCADDLAKFCSDAQAGPAGMIARMECLEAHEKELSDACRNFEAGMGGPRMERAEAIREKREFRQNCISDMARFCRDAGPMQGGMMKCLNEHESELSAPCSRILKALR